MPGASYTDQAKLQVHVVSQSPHTFVYKLWTAQKGDKAWTPLDEVTIESPEKEYGPFPVETRLAYTLLEAGNPGTDWRTEVMLSQGGQLLSCSPPPETGITTDGGAARRDRRVVLA